MTAISAANPHAAQQSLTKHTAATTPSNQLTTASAASRKRKERRAYRQAALEAQLSGS